ncbi:hypothetical protein ACHAXS_007806 [Conticribra weissflogii]
MGRKNRSSSLGQSASTATPPVQIGAQQRKADIQACDTLLNICLHSKDSDGRTFLHRAISAVSNKNDPEKKLDGMFLLEALVNRAKELDSFKSFAMHGKKNVANHNSRTRPTTTASSSANRHLRELMLTKDDESGYTPIHHAIINRDLLSILLLLKHLSTHENNDDPISGANAQQMQHPLGLLEGNLGKEEVFSVINDLATTLDNENLTPLQLLGATSAEGLEKCRRTLQWKSLKKNWQQRAINIQQQNDMKGVVRDENELMSPNPRRYRRRMISFGDERDHDALDYEIEEAPDSERFPQRRSRSNSFNNAPRAYHDDEDDHDDQNNDGQVENDLIPLGDEDFSLLRDDERGRDEVNEQITHESSQHRARSNSSVDILPGCVDYGCEVFTFGKADHCALGVPQFTTSGRRERRGDNFYRDTTGGKSADGNESSSYKPKRVEAFSIGEMRRKWASDSDQVSVDDAEVDSPAVAVAAATYHTLVLNRNGRLFTFGLGKGGRLGTGDESHRPLPTRIMGPLTKRVVASIAAAENHSLCSTADGAVFAWGSNRFGQLGMPSSQGQHSSKLSPRRVEDLKHSFIVAVAAGDRHSVALTKLGEVYAWGDNRSAQLGQSLLSTKVFTTNHRESSSSHVVTGSATHKPQRVEGLWSATPRRRAISIAAAEFSTLVLTLPPTLSDAESSLASLPVNVVFGWGHGNHIPMRVNFPAVDSSSSSEFSDLVQTSSSSYTKSTCINPIGIACAKFHNVACTADGRVYTWGLHSESLGIEKDDQSFHDQVWSIPSKGSNQLQSNSIASPRLVVAMLPENGGGRAVSVSASESHTAVLTAEGHLFTWGSCYGDNVLGHKGVRWQPKPRRVKRVHQAVGVALAKEHTVLLIGTSLPALPRLEPCADNDFSSRSISRTDKLSPLSLQDSALIEISRNLDMFNVIPIAIASYRLSCRPLICFCEKFLEMNLGGVLSVTNQGDLEMFLNARAGFEEISFRGFSNDGPFHPILYSLANSKDWIEHSSSFLYSLSHLIEVKSGLSSSRITTQQRKKKDKVRVDQIIEKKIDMELGENANASVVLQESMGISVTSDQTLEKLPAKKLFQEIECLPRKSHQRSSKYYCDICEVSCPDSDSYTLHKNGRKHRNRLYHVKAEEEKTVAESMMDMKRMQLMDSDGRDVYFKNQMMKGKPVTPIFPSHLPQKPTPNKISKIAKNVWASPTVTSSSNSKEAAPMTKIRSNSFQEIMNQEAKRAIASVGKHPDLSKSFVSVSSKKSPPSSSKNSVSLSSFLDKKHVQTKEKIVGGWASNPSVPKETLQKATSFFDIQKEEEAMKSKEDHMSRLSGNKWFIHQRERAASIGEIQSQQKKDEEWLQLVEEQKQIEEQIALENLKKKQAQDGTKQVKKRCGNKKAGKINPKPKAARVNQEQKGQN